MATTRCTPRLETCGDFLTVDETAAILRIGRNMAYERVADGTLPSVRFGRRIVIPRAALERLIRSAGPFGNEGRDVQS